MLENQRLTEIEKANIIILEIMRRKSNEGGEPVRKRQKPQSQNRKRIIAIGLSVAMLLSVPTMQAAAFESEDSEHAALLTEETSDGSGTLTEENSEGENSAEEEKT